MTQLRVDRRLLVLLLAAACTIAAAADARPPQASPADSGTVVEFDDALCLVCPKPIDGPGVLVIHRGRRVLLHRGACLEAWHADPDAWFQSLQARGALFNESGVGTGTIRKSWLFFGLYVLLGLVCGAVCSYLAIARGQPPIASFFLGLTFTIPAVIGVALRPAADISTLPAGVPPGLRKVPLTRAPASCSTCGSDVHPAADACAACGAARQPNAVAETERI